MKLRLGDLKRQGQQFARDGQYLAAVRALVAVIRRLPEDYEARLTLADALASFGAVDVAARVYAAAATLCITGGRPLVALVACRALEDLGRPASGQLTRFSVLYGRGSNRLASVGARLNVCDDDRTIDARELRRGCTVAELIAEAERIGGELATVGELPLKFFPVPLLSELSPVTLVRVAQALRVHRLPAGAVVFRQGDAGTSCFLLARGKVRILAERGREVATLTDGAVFGEMALVSGMPRSATVVTGEDTELLELGPEALAAMGDELSRIAPELDRLAQRRWMSNLVRQNPVFQVFSGEERQQLLQRFEAIEVPRGAVLIEQSEKPRGLYIVVRGQVARVRRAPDCAPELLERMGAGAMPGLEAIVSDAISSTSVVAITPCTVLYLSGRFFRRLAAAVPEVVQAVRIATHQVPPPIPGREISHAC